MYMYNADLHCDDCGRKLVDDAAADGDEDTGDSDDFPHCDPDGTLRLTWHGARNSERVILEEARR